MGIGQCVANLLGVRTTDIVVVFGLIDVAQEQARDQQVINGDDLLVSWQREASDLSTGGVVSGSCLAEDWKLRYLQSTSLMYSRHHHGCLWLPTRGDYLIILCVLLYVVSRSEETLWTIFHKTECSIAVAT